MKLFLKRYVNSLHKLVSFILLNLLLSSSDSPSLPSFCWGVTNAAVSVMDFNSCRFLFQVSRCQPPMVVLLDLAQPWTPWGTHPRICNFRVRFVLYFTSVPAKHFAIYSEHCRYITAVSRCWEAQKLCRRLLLMSQKPKMIFGQSFELCVFRVSLLLASYLAKLPF